MIVDAWVVTPRRGADWQSYIKQMHQLMKRLGIPYRCFVEETGVVGRVHAFLEFPSLADREKYFGKLPDDAKALGAKNEEIWDTATMEHQIYTVFI